MLHRKWHSLDWWLMPTIIDLNTYVCRVVPVSASSRLPLHGEESDCECWEKRAGKCGLMPQKPVGMGNTKTFTFPRIRRKRVCFLKKAQGEGVTHLFLWENGIVVCTWDQESNNAAFTAKPMYRSKHCFSLFSYNVLWRVQYTFHISTCNFWLEFHWVQSMKICNNHCDWFAKISLKWKRNWFIHNSFVLLLESVQACKTKTFIVMVYLHLINIYQVLTPFK